MTDRFKEALDDMPNVKSDDISEMTMDWYADNYDTLKSALTLATESEQLRKERDDLARAYTELYEAAHAWQDPSKLDHALDNDELTDAYNKAKKVNENGNA